MLLKAKKESRGYYIKMLNNKNESFFSDMFALDNGIDYIKFHYILLECNGKLESFNIYDYPYFSSKQDAEHFIELIELEIIMNKLVGG